MKDIGIYVHIPFCKRKCNYCDFLSANGSKEKISEYVKSLKEEIRSEKSELEEYYVKTIFIGGGTPSILEGDYIKEIVEEIRNNFRIDKKAEITIEANPGTITKEKLISYKEAGINRLSIGLQSTHLEELKNLSRIHTYEEFVENYKLARSIGFNNINIDLMSALPNQTLEKWEENLNVIAKLNPEHISAYSLIIEEGTQFYEKYNGGDSKELPSEELDRAMYESTKRILKEYGYSRYEISNYAKKGYECIHNSSYWRRGNYLGIGLGASSLIDEKRFSNEEDINKYIKLAYNPKNIRKNIEHLTKTARIEEFMFLGLRMCSGISKEEFKKQFNVSLEEVYKEIPKKLEEEGLIYNNGDIIKLTERGIDISNYVFEEFLL